MEDEGGVKEPVRRLRRRPSVEHTDETKSPSTPATPTKKRGRVAAKPLLELIDENVPENSPKRTTRRSIARDIVDEEKPLTPARRSTRVKSNTSIVSETPAEDEKPQTPARRNTRVRSNTSIVSDTPTKEEKPQTPARRTTKIKLNTSIVSETPQSFESPRAKRAATRRTSQVGSDTEAAVTPARTRRTSVDKQTTPDKTTTPGRTRRTRKDSASSDTQVEVANKPTSLITEVITEEPETTSQKSTSLLESKNAEKQHHSPSSPRKSPRLQAKGGKSKSGDEAKHNEANPTSASLVKTSPIKEKANLSESSVNLINSLDKDPKKNKLNLNKSTSALQNSDESKNRRQRTKSWTTPCASPSYDGNFFSDNENVKKKIMTHEKLLGLNRSGSGDSVLNKSEAKNNEVEISKMSSNTSSKKKKKHGDVPMTSENDIQDSSRLNKSGYLNKSATGVTNQSSTNPDSNKENLNFHSEHNNSSATHRLFEKAPSEIKTLVFMEDSDSNSESSNKEVNRQLFKGDDQCVPVVFNPTNPETGSKPDEPLKRNDQTLETPDKLKTANNYSCEPMDIDETLPENVSLNIPQKPENISQNVPNRSKRKSLGSHSNSQDLEKTENKSTLILTELMSTTENSISKSPSKTELSKSINLPEKVVINKNLSANYLTSTPVQQKDIKILGLQMNTSVITPNIEEKKENKKDQIKIHSKNESSASISAKSESADENSDEESEISKEKSSFFDNKAEDAGDDYESGDSQDEEERRYEKDHEVLDEGETLETSDEDLSTDSDYEKDSFVVSSDPEDEELLSGSGDDLDMSDNELNMTAKSKKKYDERKKKEQKKASKEMYEARHKLTESENSKSDTSKVNKSKRIRLDSSSGEEDTMVPPKKNKRMRLESTIETNEKEISIKDNNISLSDNEEIGYKKKKRKRLSESVCDDSVTKEKEMTICEDNDNEKEDPLAIHVKQEPKTPQKELDISIVHFTGREEIQEVQVDENASMMKSNNSVDPLQMTIAQENEHEDDSDASSISENEEITKNYDSILNNLNKEIKSKQIKSKDISLNLDSKSKKISKDPVVEELNLTITKKSKTKSKHLSSDTPYEKTVKRVFKKLSANDEDSVDTIDMKLLFSEESNSSNEDSNAKKSSKDNAESIIPLKRTEAKTDIRANTSEDDNRSNLLETSTRKKLNKGKSKHQEETADYNEDGEEMFFIDTTGDRFEMDNSINISNKKGKPIEEQVQDNENSETANNEVNVLHSNTPFSEKKKKKKSESQNFETSNGAENNASISKSPKERKKKKKATELDVSVFETVELPSEVANASMDTVSHVKKDKKKSMSEQMESENNGFGAENDISVKRAKKKKNEHNLQSNNTVEDTEIIQDTSALNISKTENKKKKRKISEGSVQNITDEPIEMPNLRLSEVANPKKVAAQVENEVTSMVSETEQKISRKRKHRDSDACNSKAKVHKVNSFDKVRVPRLSTAILSQLEDKPSKEVLEMKKSMVVSTSEFKVEQTKRRKTKPSHFMEESVYLNTDDDDDHMERQQNGRVKKPKVLPTLPTVSTSHSGFTTNFHVTVLPKKIEFVAQSSGVTNFKNEFLREKRKKKMRTNDVYKKHRNVTLAKY